MKIIQERSSSNAPQVSYTRGLDLSGSLAGAGGIGGLLGRTVHASASPYVPNASAFYHADGNGNITALVDSTGTLQATYRYDPYGRTLASSGSLAPANLMRFSSKPWIQNSAATTDRGLYYYGYRFYEVNTGRWLNRDPIDDIGHRLINKQQLIGKVYHLSITLSNIQKFNLNNPIYQVDADGQVSGSVLASIIDEVYSYGMNHYCTPESLDCAMCCNVRAMGKGLGAITGFVLDMVESVTVGAVAPPVGVGDAVLSHVLFVLRLKNNGDSLNDCLCKCKGSAR